jgi:DNA-binding winged helix-turn-helix (wHTH) protein
MLLERPGELLTRDQIARQLWPGGTFVDAEHGVNSAVNRIREALGDSATSPRFLETLARRGYRFVAPVERIALSNSAGAPNASTDSAPLAQPADPPPALRARILASPEELPKIPWTVAQTLFLLLQIMYLGFYIGALANLPEIDDLFAALLPRPPLAFTILIVTAAILIPVRAFLLCAFLFHAPASAKNSSSSGNSSCPSTSSGRSRPSCYCTTSISEWPWPALPSSPGRLSPSAPSSSWVPAPPTPKPPPPPANQPNPAKKRARSPTKVSRQSKKNVSRKQEKRLAKARKPSRESEKTASRKQENRLAKARKRLAPLHPRLLRIAPKKASKPARFTPQQEA